MAWEVLTLLWKQHTSWEIKARCLPYLKLTWAQSPATHMVLWIHQVWSPSKARKKPWAQSGMTTPPLTKKNASKRGRSWIDSWTISAFPFLEIGILFTNNLCTCQKEKLGPFLFAPVNKYIHSSVLCTCTQGWLMIVVPFLPVASCKELGYGSKWTFTDHVTLLISHGTYDLFVCLSDTKFYFLKNTYYLLSRFRNVGVWEGFPGEMI